MPSQSRSRRTLLPLLLLLGGLLGAGPFVPHTVAAGEGRAADALPDIPGLAAWLGGALAVAALAGIAVTRRSRTETVRTETETTVDEPREIDPLLAALRGPAAFAPDDLDARLGVRTSVGSPTSADDAPHWVKRIDPRRPADRGLEPEGETERWRAFAVHDGARR